MEFMKKREFFEIQFETGNLLNFKELYGNGNPVWLEIGCGRGEFISKKSELMQNINFLGIEIKEKRIKTIVRTVDENLNRNVRILQKYVDKEITKLIPPGSFERIFIQFPDPWPKRKHKERRLLQNEFIDILNTLLTSRGILEISTDHPGYKDWINEKFKSRKDFQSVFTAGFSMELPEGHIETYFELSKREEGFPPFFFKYQKVS
jgi:tRNA (guanine-N7-)-methyltransferase